MKNKARKAARKGGGKKPKVNVLTKMVLEQAARALETRRAMSSTKPPANPKYPGRFPTVTTPENKVAFLEAYARSGSYTKASEAIGVPNGQHCRWRRDDPEFAAGLEFAHREAMDRLEEEAYRRAYEGTEVPVYYKGVLADIKMEKSDQLLQFMLKGGRPDKYRDRTDLNLAGQNGQPPIEVAHRGLSDEVADEMICKVLGVPVPGASDGKA